MMTFWRLWLSGVVAATMVACTGGSGGGPVPSACDKSDTLDLTKKAGDCTGLDLAKPLGTRAECADKVKPCSTVEVETLATMVSCLENLPICAAAAKATFLNRQGACYASVSSLSTACKDSVFGSTVIPGPVDAGFDAGPPEDAGRKPSAGEGALDLIAVADETGFAFAWSARQVAQVPRWELNVFGSADGGRLPEIYLSPGSLRSYELAAPRTAADGGVGVLSRQFFLAAVDDNGFQIFGAVPDAGTPPDAGPVFVDAGACATPTDCPPEKVCDLGVCKTQSCQAGGPVTCPSGYICEPGPMSCLRQFSDAGTFDAGVAESDGGQFVPLPLLSRLVSLVTGMPAVSPETVIGGFAAHQVDLVAIDSARQFVALEQENQLFGHYTSQRGKELVNDIGSASPIDPAGSRARLAYVPQSETIFACYNFGRGVRIRRSHDLGKTWGSDAVTLAPEEDGGVSARFHDCTIAPWKNGSAIFAYIEDDSIVVRTVSEELSVPPLTAADYVFPGPDAGNVFSPQRPFIATLPGPLPDGGVGDMVHVGFTGTRSVGVGTDTEIYGVYRDSSMAAFVGPKQINFKSGGMGSGSPEDHVSIAIHPKTGKALAAYTTIELGIYSTVYVALFNPAFKLNAAPWITGTDLTVFAKRQTESLLFPARQDMDVWDAFSPSLAVTRAGKIFLSVVAGKRTGTTRDLRMYLVGFDFDVTSPISGGGQGWFLPPAVKLSDVKVFDPRPSTGGVPPNVSAICTDTQLSVYGAFIEGIGPISATENRAVFISRP